jgi:transcriptional regulator with XRE-family HTH domain
VEKVDLKTLRKKAGLTQKEMADIIGCSFQFVSNIETGHRQLNEKQKRKVSAYFNVPEDCIMPNSAEYLCVRDERRIYPAGWEKVDQETLEAFLDLAVQRKDYVAVQVISQELAARKG